MALNDHDKQLINHTYEDITSTFSIEMIKYLSFKLTAYVTIKNAILSDGVDKYAK